MFYRLCIQEYFQLVLCWEVCPLSECPLSEVSLYSQTSLIRILAVIPGGVGHDHVNPDFADSALLLPLNLYGEKRRPFCWANKTCRALL